MITYSTVQSDQDLQGILELQRKNLPQSLTTAEKAEQGFVTVNHDLATLQKMHAIEPSVIAKDGDSVIAYLLAMTSKSKHDIPILEPMFGIFEKIKYNGKAISDYHYLIVGQVCVDKKYRGSGVLDAAYEYYRHHFKNKYDFTITEIITSNTRSMRAHVRIGFDILHEYPDSNSTHWSIVVWDWVRF